MPRSGSDRPAIPAPREEHDSMYAIIRTGGKQYRVRPGEILLVERLPVTEGAHVFQDVLLTSDEGGNLRVGQPLVDGASVQATVLGELKAKKVIVFKKKKRKGYEKKRGHRQELSVIKIESITV